MSPERLGLFDTPYDRREVWASLAVVCLMIAGVLAILPVRNVPVGHLTSFIPMVDAFLFVTDMTTAALLYAQAAVFRSRALTVLATGFVITGFLLIPHALTFPGAFDPEGLLGAKVNTTGWIANFRRMTPPLAILLYVLLRRADAAAGAQMHRPPARIIWGVLAGFLVAVGATLLATSGHDWLPEFFLDHEHLTSTYAIAVETGVFGLFVLATYALFRTRRSVLDIWLLVALAAWIIQSLVILTLQARFTIGWYGLYLTALTGNLVVMIALLVEAHRLYSRLATSAAARHRERDNRLMSMDAVAAAMSQEAGQPLTAVMLNVRGGLSWLDRPAPEIDKAIVLLREAVEAGEGTFNAMKSTAAMFAVEPGATVEFNLNDLVRTTASVLGREIVDRKVSLKMDLDEDLPPILGNRVQLQRVLINLFTNAMESLEATPNRQHRMLVTTKALEDGSVLLEITDNGIGITPEQMAHIFDAFFTTKATGTGLGLTLCRTVVEEHGGRLWASHGGTHGATFSMRLPASSLSYAAPPAYN